MRLQFHPDPLQQAGELVVAGKGDGDGAFDTLAEHGDRRGEMGAETLLDVGDDGIFTLALALINLYSQFFIPVFASNAYKVPLLVGTNTCGATTLANGLSELIVLLQLFNAISIVNNKPKPSMYFFLLIICILFLPIKYKSKIGFFQIIYSKKDLLLAIFYLFCSFYSF